MSQRGVRLSLTRNDEVVYFDKKLQASPSVHSYLRDLARDLTTKMGRMATAINYLLSSAVDMADAYQSGVATVSAMPTLWVGADREIEILKAWAVCGTAPTGQAILIDWHANGVTIFTDQSKRPSIAASAFKSIVTVPDVRAIGKDDVLECQVDQVGSGVAGADVRSFLLYREI